MGNLETESYVSAVTMQFSRLAPLGFHMLGASQVGQDQNKERELVQKLFHMGHGGTL